MQPEIRIFDDIQGNQLQQESSTVLEDTENSPVEIREKVTFDFIQHGKEWTITSNQNNDWANNLRNGNVEEKKNFVISIP